ncbi:hypothetical protein BVC80_9043g22 [Macleaya cordata]|uniref:Uncharacterized protein n=1 Tax=Macleaya cordata TaxID=56857 RepID=A0A200R2M5_MACCD|nr:hypothetical protein BVC80_9043g22 [Macleaya cordata]
MTTPMEKKQAGGIFSIERVIVWIELLRADMKTLELVEDITLDRIEWRSKLHTADSRTTPLAVGNDWPFQVYDKFWFSRISQVGNVVKADMQIPAIDKSLL